MTDAPAPDPATDTFVPDKHGNIFRIAIREIVLPHTPKYTRPDTPERAEDDAAREYAKRTPQEFVSQAYASEEELYLAAAHTKATHGGTYTIQLQYSPVPEPGSKPVWLRFR